MQIPILNKWLHHLYNMPGELGDRPVTKALSCALAHPGLILIKLGWLIFSLLNELMVLPPMLF
jgi:hypothetical protein